MENGRNHDGLEALAGRRGTSPAKAVSPAVPHFLRLALPLSLYLDGIIFIIKLHLTLDDNLL
jgi:hypothetical protein